MASSLKVLVLHVIVYIMLPQHFTTTKHATNLTRIRFQTSTMMVISSLGEYEYNQYDDVQHFSILFPMCCVQFTILTINGLVFAGESTGNHRFSPLIQYGGFLEIFP